MDVCWHDRSLPACQRPLLEERQARNRRLVAERRNKGSNKSQEMDLQDARLESELEEKQHFRNSSRASSSSFQDCSSFPAAPNEGGKALPDACPVLLCPERRDPTLYILSQGARADMHPRLGLWEQSPGQTPGDDGSSCKFLPTCPDDSASH